MAGSETQLEVSGLAVDVFDEAIAAHRRIVSDVSFALPFGRGLGITGESGSGKTTLSLALSGLLPAAARTTADRIELSFARPDASRQFRLRQATNQIDRLLQPLRGRGIFTLFQEPRASLNPYRTIGWQLGRCVRSASRARENSALASHHAPVTALTEVGLDADVLRHYPHELSTGMCQRVFLAMACLLDSLILIADEPFASVDAETQERLSKLVRDWTRNKGVTLVLVSHDLQLLRDLTDHVLVMYRGQVAESGPTREVLGRDKLVHPYSWLLGELGDPAKRSREFASGLPIHSSLARCCFAPRCAWSDSAICVEEVPELRRAGQVSEPTSTTVPVDQSHRLRCVRHPIAEMQRPAPRSQPEMTEIHANDSREILRVRDLSKDFSTGWIRRKSRRVLQGVGFSVTEDERLGIMGPSGQGKTTLARVILGVVAPTTGSVELLAGGRWQPIARLRADERMHFRRRVQMVYQDADLVLDPAARIGDALVEAYRVFDPRLDRSQAYRLSAQLLQELALPASILEAYPYRLSGGERKRVALARSLAVFGCPFEARADEPWRLLVLDEPTAGVDVFLQAILGRFLIWAQRRLRLSYLVISHDEEFVRQFCHRALRLHQGRISASASHANDAKV
jgi:peptide/nickel transport system ATP-binding protein